MSDKPILFSAPMVRALLAGSKTQTRRIIRPPAGVDPNHFMVASTWIDPARGVRFVHWPYDNAEEVFKRLPIARGDRLYAREALARQTTDQGVEFIGYAADGKHVEHTVAGWPFKRPKVPGIHMPRWASRITLTVTDVRVQRLQDISYDDVQAEGCPTDPGYRDTTLDGSGGKMVLIGTARWQSPRAWYHQLWDSINGPGSWEANPWVAAYTFTVEHQNIDARAAA